MNAAELSREELITHVNNLSYELEKAYQIIRNLQKEVFGKKSDKLISLHPEQEFLPGIIQKNQIIELPQEEVKVPAHKRRKGGKKVLPANIETEERRYFLPEGTKCACGGELKAIGFEDPKEELEIKPAEIKRLQHLACKYACNCCKSGIVTAEIPESVQPIKGVRASANTLTHLAVSKFCDHLPVTRQVEILSRKGLEISKQTVCDWLLALALLLERISGAILKDILQSSVAHADETKVSWQDEEGKFQSGYLWAILAPGRGVYFRFDESRSGEAAKELFKNFKGIFISDDYGGYNAVSDSPGLKRAACWAHVRRKFIELQKFSEANLVVKKISEIYKIEKLSKDLAADRLEKSLDAVEDIFKLLRQLKDKLSPKHLLQPAINYALNQEKELKVFIYNPDVRPDNNLLENQIRPVALGRKNWLFAGSKRGADAIATYYTIFNSCRLAKINPETYLRDVLTRINSHPVNKIHELIPKNWIPLNK